jgi:hypothetical protein
MSLSATSVSSVDSRRRDAWKRRAGCRDLPPEYFFGRPDRYGVDRHDPGELELALACCFRRCPVREDCLADAFNQGPDTFGVWGGTTKADRERLNRRIARKKCPVCGSAALHGEGPMQVCGGCGQSWATVRDVHLRTGLPAAGSAEERGVKVVDATAAIGRPDGSDSGDTGATRGRDAA